MATVTRDTPKAGIVTPTATQSEKRDVSTELRWLFPNKNHTLSIVGKENDGKSMGSPSIKKRKVNSLRPEWFTYLPLAGEFTVSTWTAGTSTAALTDASDLKQYDTVINSANNTVGRVDSISTNDVVISTIGGTTFSASANDKLVVMATNYHSGSSSPKYISKTEDNQYNVIMEFREPYTVNWDKMNSPYYFEGGVMETEKRKVLFEAMRKLERSFVFSERPSTTNNNAAGTTLDTAFPSMRGTYQWAQNELTIGGGMTYETFSVDVMDGVSDSAEQGDDWLMYTSNLNCGKMSLFAKDAYRIEDKEGTYGYQYMKFMTSRGTVTVKPHDAFDQGAYKNQALIFRPSELKYCYYEGHDIQIKENIQPPSAHYKQDEIYGYVSLEVSDAGRSAIILKDMF